MTVYVVKDWEYFLEASRSCRVKLYTVRQVSNQRFEVRARAGSIGYVAELSQEKLEDTKKRLEIEGFVEVVRVESDDVFLS